MGVTKLWQLLDEGGEGEETSLSQCAGQSWAVDLSAWILHARTMANVLPGLSADHNMIRTVFSRALCLLKHGIRPLCVMDGRLAPEVKSQTLQGRSDKPKVIANDRSGLQRNNDMCREMLRCLGVPVIRSAGEAEKTCALLNQQGIVDACLSDDSDCLAYGATTVYRNLDLKKETVQKHSLPSIEEKLGLNRRDLVVIALLSGCDYGDGVKGVGPKKVIEMIGAVKKYCPDVLKRVCEWRDKATLTSLQEETERVRKATHCTQCHHTGSKVQHRKEGCHDCSSAVDCHAESGTGCSCDYHTLQQRVLPYKVELHLRAKALSDQGFPDKKLLSEFLDSGETFSISEVSVSLPRWKQLGESVGLDLPDLMKKLVPVLVHMHLHGVVDIPDTDPDSILNNCVRRTVPCFLVRWQRWAFDQWTPEAVIDVEKTPMKDMESRDPYVLAVACDLMKVKYPELVQSHLQHSSAGKKGKGKRAAEDRSQPKMTDFFKVKKVLNFDTCEQP